MYKKILGPLDGSELSKCSLEHVKAIAGGCHVPEIVLLMVVELFPHHGFEWVTKETHLEIEAKTEAQAKEALSEIAEQLKKEGIAAETVVVRGTAADEILDYADKNQVDLIIMSTHGRSGISRWAMGSVTDKILRHSTVPVLVVSPPGCRRQSA